MNWEAIGAVGEILGAIGVIATLGYLAVQIRQNTASNRQAAARSTVDSINRLNIVSVEQPDLLDLLTRGMANLAELDPREGARFHVLWMSSFIVYQQVFFHAERGEIEPHLRNLIDSHMFEYLGTPGLGAWWEANSKRFSSKFVAYVDAGKPGK